MRFLSNHWAMTNNSAAPTYMLEEGFDVNKINTIIGHACCPRGKILRVKFTLHRWKAIE